MFRSRSTEREREPLIARPTDTPIVVEAQPYVEPTAEVESIETGPQTYSNGNAVRVNDTRNVKLLF